LTQFSTEIHKSIIEASKKGDQKSQYKLYQLYSKAMFNICYRMMNSFEEAEDILQEAFTEVFAKLHTFRYESTFGAWFKRIVINKCINEIKRRKADLVLYDEFHTFESADENEIEIETKDDSLNVKRIHKAIEKLPDGYRIIFSLYMLEGYDHSEISGILDISESTSKSQYMRAKRKIKEILNYEFA
jgi:RNA polymerase sigma-70 factor, ECF subfamily